MPLQKLRIVEIFRTRGDVVAMIGDGMNDAPTLRLVDVGSRWGRQLPKSHDTQRTSC